MSSGRTSTHLAQEVADTNTNGLPGQHPLLEQAADEPDIAQRALMSLIRHRTLSSRA